MCVCPRGLRNHLVVLLVSNDITGSDDVIVSSRYRDRCVYALSSTAVFLAMARILYTSAITFIRVVPYSCLGKIGAPAPNEYAYLTDNPNFALPRTEARRSQVSRVALSAVCTLQAMPRQPHLVRPCSRT
jgi:hypothetical protein